MDKNQKICNYFHLNDYLALEESFSIWRINNHLTTSRRRRTRKDFNYGSQKICGNCILYSNENNFFCPIKKSIVNYKDPACINWADGGILPEAYQTIITSRVEGFNIFFKDENGNLFVPLKIWGRIKEYDLDEWNSFILIRGISEYFIGGFDESRLQINKWGHSEIN